MNTATVKILIAILKLDNTTIMPPFQTDAGNK